MKRVLAVVSFALLAAAGSAAHADKGKGQNRGAEAAKTESSVAVENLRTAASLVRYGDAKKDAMALITAAKMIGEAGGSASTAERVKPQPGQKAGEDGMTLDAVLARAKTYAAGRADLLALADDVAKASTRGGVNGPGRIRTVVNTRGNDVFRVAFRGGEPARILVSGDGDSDLDLYVYDENGNLVCKDDDATDDMVCGWTPRWTGQFRIVVRNTGVANQYILVHN